jgi:predicted permease
MVGVVLLIACANVSGLMLARATTREREMAVRFALGAARTRIIRQLLTESMILAVLGGTLGVIVAFWGAQALTAFVSNNWPWPLQLDVHLDARVLIFTGSMSMLAGILLGVVPAFRSTRGDLVSALKKNSGDGSAISGGVAGRFKIGDSLVVGQVALSVLVLVISTLLLRTLANLKSIDPGFDTRQVLIFGIDPTSAGYKESRIRSLYRDLQARLANIPGVISASYSSEVLLSDGLTTTDIHLEGQSDKSTVETEIMAVGPGFFETMRIRLLVGRGLGQSDVASARPVAVVNQAFANRFFTDRTPVGLHVRRKAGDEQIESEIVGVVADTKYDQLRKQVEPTLYMPVEGGRAYFELRAASNPAALIPAVRQAVSDLDNNLPLLNVRTQSETVDRLLFNERLIARLSALFAALALVLVCIGIYGLLSYEVSRRTREIGIRSALGAHPSDVLRLVVGQGIVLALAGTGIGIAASFGITRYLQSMLYEVRPSDPLTFAVTSLFLIVVALLACYVPARRAANVDPMVALRYE